MTAGGRGGARVDTGQPDAQVSSTQLGSLSLLRGWLLPSTELFSRAGPPELSAWGPGVLATDHLLLWVQVAPAVCRRASGDSPLPLCFNKVSLKSYVSHITGEDGALTTSAQMAEEDTSSKSLPFVPFQSLPSPKATSLLTLNIRDHFCLAWNFGSMTSYSVTLGSGFTPSAFH